MIAFIFVAFFIAQSCPAESQIASEGFPQTLTIADAFVCTDLKNSTPQGKAVIFSLRMGKVYCFSDFNHVPEETVIFHTWFLKENMVSQVKLLLKPPRWSTYSSITLRETDRGSWRVEITDKYNHLITTVRFSVID
jgi:hypothetical protein